MATEKQAREARDIHQKKLLKFGAHAFSVEPLEDDSKKFAVVAWVQRPAKGKPSQELKPQTLEIEEEGKNVQVPLVVRESKPFQLE